VAEFGIYLVKEGDFLDRQDEIRVTGSQLILNFVE
jgi:hypothetical protein